MEIEELKKKYNEICNEYLYKFCLKNGFEYDPFMWIADNVGTIIMIADMFVNMEDIRYDVDNNIPKGKFNDWYWKSVELHEFGVSWMNYESYCKGAPDKYTPEVMEKLRNSFYKIEDAKKEFEEMINNYIK